MSDPYAMFATNQETKFSPFNLTLKNGANLTGIVYLPKTGLLTQAATKPLLVGIHGATTSAHSWDVHPKYTASTYCDLLGIPFVAFHRPNFLQSSGWLVDNALDNPSAPKSRYHPSQEGQLFVEEGKWYHEYILPAIWEHFAQPNNCTALVTTSHSMSVPITVIAAGLYSKTIASQRQYAWAGMVLTGYGTEPSQAILDARDKFSTNVYDPSDFPYGHDPALHIGPFLKEDKISLMTGSEGTCDAELRELCWKQDTPFFLEEVINMGTVWQARSDELKADVQIPVLYAMGTQEWLWKHTRAHVDEFVRGFVNAPRVEGALVTGAPHAIEWSRMAAGWWTRVFGWASEVATSLEVAKLGLKEYD